MKEELLLRRTLPADQLKNPAEAEISAYPREFAPGFGAIVSTAPPNIVPFTSQRNESFGTLKDAYEWAVAAMFAQLRLMWARDAQNFPGLTEEEIQAALIRKYGDVSWRTVHCSLDVHGHKTAFRKIGYFRMKTR